MVGKGNNLPSRGRPIRRRRHHGPGGAPRESLRCSTLVARAEREEHRRLRKIDPAAPLGKTSRSWISWPFADFLLMGRRTISNLAALAEESPDRPRRGRGDAASASIADQPRSGRALNAMAPQTLFYTARLRTRSAAYLSPRRFRFNLSALFADLLGAGGGTQAHPQPRLGPEADEAIDEFPESHPGAMPRATHAFAAGLPCNGSARTASIVKRGARRFPRSIESPHHDRAWRPRGLQAPIRLPRRQARQFDNRSTGLFWIEGAPAPSCRSGRRASSPTFPSRQMHAPRRSRKRREEIETGCSMVALTRAEDRLYVWAAVSALKSRTGREAGTRPRVPMAFAQLPRAAHGIARKLGPRRRGIGTEEGLDRRWRLIMSEVQIAETRSGFPSNPACRSRISELPHLGQVFRRRRAGSARSLWRRRAPPSRSPRP